MSTERGRAEAELRRPTGAGAFGLAISSDASLPGLATPTEIAGARRLEHRLTDQTSLEERLVGGMPERVLSKGRGALRIECHQHGSGDLLITTASFGNHLITDGGRTALSAVDGASDRWQRYALGQVLPVAASLQGLEIFHAGAVAVDGEVVVLAGPSGAGKSSIAASLVASGAAEFFTDDVLTLDAGAFDLIAYPGPALVGIPNERLPALADRIFAGPPWLSDGGKAYAPVQTERRALPVRAFFRLSQEEEAAATSFKPCPPDRLMATTFDGVSRGPERLLRLLRVAAMLAADGRAQDLRYRSGTDPAAVAAALLARLPRAARGDGA